jgi:hypothetical protein
VKHWNPRQRSSNLPSLSASLLRNFLPIMFLSIQRSSAATWN